MINKDFNYTSQVEQFVGRDKNKSICRSVTIQLTSACNLRCDYCYECFKNSERLSKETATKICDCIIRELSTPGGFLYEDSGLIIDFIGGDPMLEVELMDYIMDYLVRGIYKVRPELLPYLYFNLSTNGVNFFEERVQKFVKKWGYMLGCGISIDGVKELHDAHRVDLNGEGSFDRAWAAFLACRDIYGTVLTKMTFVPDSFKYLKDSVIMMIENGARNVNCNYAYEPIYTYDDAKVLFHQLKDLADWLIENKCSTSVSMLDASGIGMKADSDSNYCGGTGYMLAFDTKGDIYPCIRYCPVSVGEKAKEAKLGDVNGLFLTKEQRDFYDKISKITRTSQSPQECIDCPISSGCGWCSGYNFQCGDVNRKVTNICNAHKARVLGVIYYRNKRYLELGDVMPISNKVPIEWRRNILAQEEIDMMGDLEHDANSKLKHSIMDSDKAKHDMMERLGI